MSAPLEVDRATGAPDRAVAVALALLLAVGLLALLHRASGGLVFASRPLTVAGFASLLAAIAYAGRGRWPRSRSPRGRSWIAIAAGGVLLVLATWWGDPGGLPGDYTQHRMYTYQLLNGFAAPHVPYAGVPSHYTFLQSAAIATLMQLTGLSFYYAALGFACVVSATVACLAHAVASRGGLGQIGSFFFAGLLVWYGGCWFVGQDDFFLYLPAVQLSMPFVSRNLALLLVLMLIALAQAIGRREIDESAGVIAAGVLVGLLGLTRPWEFGASLLLLLGWAVHRRSRVAWVGVAIALALAAGYFAPLLAAWWQLGIHATREVERAALLPTSPFLYAPLGLFVALSAVHWRAAPAAIRGCWLALAVIAVTAGLGAVAAALGGGGVLALEAGLVKLDRVGQLIALPLFAVAAHGLETLRGRARPALAAGFLLIGFASSVRVTSTWLDGEPSWWSLRWSQPPSWVFGMEGSRLYLRHLLDDPRAVVMVPRQIGDLIARANGVDVVFSRTAVPIWRERPAGAISQAQRRALTDEFYAGLGRGRIDGALLSAVGARWFVSPLAIVSDRVEEVATLGNLGGVLWRLYRVVGEPPGG